MSRVSFHCEYCDQVFTCLQATVGQARGGHYSKCVCRPTNKKRKRRALEPNVYGALNNFDYKQMEIDAVQDDFFYDIDEDWGDENEERINSIDEKYRRLFSSVSHTMACNGDLYLFQMNLHMLYSSGEHGMPMRTGWIRDNNGGTTNTCWEDYVLINNFHAKYGLSVTAGDDLLKLLKEIGLRNNVDLKIPTTMKSIRYIHYIHDMYHIHVYSDLCSVYIVQILHSACR